MSDPQTRLERELIQSARRGDLHAFNRLVESYQDMAYHTAYRILNDPEAAADATQEAFISAYRHLNEFRDGSFKAWLLRIVTNACYDILRARQRHPSESIDDLLGADEEREPPDFIDHREGPEERAVRAELNRFLQEGIAALPDDQRVVLVLADVQGLSYEEIASATRTNLGTVKSRLNRARLRLRDWLLERQELLPERYRLDSGPL
ncbi:MAG: sigma-70 family RNA polymerase sigma factor [Chloroflexi bacterium]|nr:sigma-70 family RNA polymerase sigma factor [Chloroflexota bacterium]MBI3733902.1 sigma-70 family RNA polymerase sigma factor [Chloroflexota bacterium]